MDLQVDRMPNFTLHDSPKLREGERVEVRQRDVGLRGSWHPGTVVGLKAGGRLVEYDELLTDDGLRKLRESIPCPKLNDMPGICSPPKSHPRAVTPTLSPSKRRGLLRPCPPLRTEPSPLTWKGGLFVDVFYQDAWWEAVLLNDVTSLDDDTLVDVIFPDEGDVARVYVKDMRISQCWDEVSGDWSLKGSLDLSRFLKRRGIGKKEVSLTADSDCRTSEVCNSSLPNGEKLNRNRWTKTGSSLLPLSKVPSSCKTVNNKSYEESSPSKSHEQSIPIRSSTEESAVQTIMPSRDGSLVFDLPESECHLEILSCIDGSKKLSCEQTELRHGGTLFGNDFETVDIGQNLPDGEDVAECNRLPSCKGSEEVGLWRETAGKEFIEGSIFFKRRKIGETPSSSYVSEVKLSDSQSVRSSFLLDHKVGILKPSHEESSSGRGECNTTHWDAVHGQGLLNSQDLCKLNSAVVVKEPETGLSFGSDHSYPLKELASSSPATGKLDRSKRLKMESKLLQKRPANYLLALEAPVRKSREEYDQIMLAGKAALGEGVSSGRYRRKKVFAQGLEDPDNEITSIGHKKFEGGVSEMVTRPKNKAGKVLPVCDQKSRENHGKSTTREKLKLGGVILENFLRPRRKGRGAPAQKPSKGHQIIPVGKKAIEHTAVEQSVKIRKRAGEIFWSAGRQEKRVGKDTLRSFRDHLMRQKQAKALKRKASDLSLVLEAGSKDVKLLKVSKSDRESEQSKAATTLPLSNFEDSIATKRIAHKRRRARIASCPAEPPSASWFAACSGSNLVKRKAPRVSCALENGGRSLFDRGETDQAEAASVSNFSSFKVKKLKKTDDRSLKNWAREIGIKAVLEAGFTIEYRPRRGHLSSDAVYTSPKGYSYWSLPKAWQALGNEKKKVRVKVDKAVIQQVLSKIYQDEHLRSAFEKLDRFSGTCVEEVMKQANMTYAELTDILIEDLRVLRKHVWKPKGKKTKGYIEGKQEKQKSGKKPSSSADLKTSLLSSGTLVVKKRGRKRKQEVQTVSGKVDCKASTSRVYSRLKHVQGNGSPKFEKNRSKSMEGTSKILNRFRTSTGSSKAAFKAGTSSINMASQKRRNNLKGSSKNLGLEEENFKKESSKKERKELKPRSGLRLEVRPSTSCMDDSSEEFSSQSKRTILSWLIGRGAILETERVSCVDQASNEVLKEGISTREGISCRCCKRVYMVKGFEEHGANQAERPNSHLLFASGKTLLDHQLKAWNVEMDLRSIENYKGVSADDTNDDTCLVCGDGGVLICCDFCPSTFHASCLQLDNVPEGKWYCPKCCCGVCKSKYNLEDEAVCRQCEHRYHIACLQGGHTILREQFFCRDSCKKIYSGLKSLIGITHSLDKGFSWSLLHCIEEPQPEDLKIVTGINSKLAVALLVLKECFNPMDDPRTNIDMITHAAYNRRSQFSRLNYVGFYTVVLERDEEIISAASIRIHGARVAEMPLIGTRHKYRRQGMCRLLVGVIEKLLMSLEVATFILPAIPELYATWTQAFGFRPLDSPLRSEIKDLSMMMFPGTDLLQKSLQGDTAVSSPSSPRDQNLY